MIFNSTHVVVMISSLVKLRNNNNNNDKWMKSGECERSGMRMGSKGVSNESCVESRERSER